MRAARALLRWSAADLVRESGVSLATIHRAESLDGITAMTVANATAVRRALENAGVELIEENGGGLGARLKHHLEFIAENRGGPGVRLRKSVRGKSGMAVMREVEGYNEKFARKLDTASKDVVEAEFNDLPAEK
jgi:hypothetical protein